MAERVHEAAERKLIFMVSADGEERARQAAEHLTRHLSDSGLFARLEARRNQSLLSSLGSFYFPYRFQLLSPPTREELKAGRQETFERRVLSRYLNPLGGLNSDLIAADPLLVLPDFLASLAPKSATNLGLDEGYLTVREADRSHILVLGELASSPFSMQLQDTLSSRLANIRAQLSESYPGTTLALAGVFPHAAAGTIAARQEVSTVGVGSLLGVMLLFVIVFRSLRPFFFAALTVIVGCIGGFAVCLAVFGQVHLMTLVFGASLVGISVDYALHYFCERLALDDTASSALVVRRVFSGITLGLVTSIVGFVGILVAPFPGLREMAVFSSVGLTCAWLCVVVLYPVVPQAIPQQGNAALRWAAAYGRFWERGGRHTVWVVVLLLILSALACLRLLPLDDFRLLQTRNPHVQEEEERVRSLLGQDYASQFFLIFAEDQTALLEREEDLIDDLAPLLQDGSLADLTALSRFVPSPGRQSENRELLRLLLTPQSTLFPNLIETVGLPGGAREAFASALDESEASPPLTLEAWLTSPVSEPFRHLWLGTEDQAASVVTLSGVQDVAALEAIAEGRDGVAFVDRIGDFSEIFSSYRNQTFWLTIVSYVVVALLLVWRYGLKGAASVIAVPLAAALVAFGSLGLLAEPISLFNVMALLLVLGIGVDYGIFFREARGVRAATLLAVAMSAATTVLAFGLLSASSTMAVHSFGLTLLIGIAAAFLLSPLSAVVFPPTLSLATAGAGHEPS